jgi:predicted GTPase
MNESDEFKKYCKSLVEKAIEFQTTTVSGAVIGQSGSGKSSLINAIGECSIKCVC